MTNIDDLSTQAIQKALKQEWLEAIELNKKILELDSTNVPALNRLGRSYLETEQIKLAKKAFTKVLDIDKHNSIAGNFISKIKLGTTSTTNVTSNFSFIEEPGRTRTVVLYKLAPHTVLGTLVTSQMVQFKTNSRKIAVQTLDKNFIGYIPEDLAMHLLQLIKMGNKYEAAIKTVTKAKVEIFIREVSRAPKLKGVPSFSAKETSQMYQFLPTDPVSEVPMEMEHVDEEINEI
jgi:tetratricopeptide (TPR) repeat protein